MSASPWREALAEIAARLQGIINEWGPEAVLPYAYAGTMGFLQQHGISNRFFQQMGASRLAYTICSEAGFEGYLYTIGSTIGIEPEDYAHARLILIWGSNTLTSNLHLWPFIQDARKQGRTRHRHRPGLHPHRQGRRRVAAHPTPGPTAPSRWA